MFCRESTWKTRTSLSPNLFQGLWCFVILNMTEYVYHVYHVYCVSCCFIAFPYQMWFLFEQGQIPNSGWKLPCVCSSHSDPLLPMKISMSLGYLQSLQIKRPIWQSINLWNQNHCISKKNQQISINIPMFHAQIPIFPGKSWVNPSILAPLCGSPVGGSPVAPWCRRWIPCTPPNRCPTRWGWPHVMVYPTINMG